MECDICKEVAGKKNPIFPCDYCENKYCKQCGDLSTTEVKVFEQNKRTLQFQCQKCRKFESHSLLMGKIEDKDNIIKAKEEIICLLKEKITKLEKIQTGPSFPISYSRVAQNDNINVPKLNTNLPSIIIKPKTSKTLQKLKLI